MPIATSLLPVADDRYSLINKKGVCQQCTELNGIFNPKQKAQEELIKIEMVRKADEADKDRLFDLRTQIMRAIDPFESDAAELQLRQLQHNKRVMDNYLKEK